MSDPAAERRGHCAMCGEMTHTGNTRSGVRSGRLLCGECSETVVYYEVECLDCGWRHSQSGMAYQWYHLRQNVQREGNSHEKEKYNFEDERHVTAWRYLGTGDD